MNSWKQILYEMDPLAFGRRVPRPRGRSPALRGASDRGSGGSEEAAPRGGVRQEALAAASWCEGALGWRKKEQKLFAFRGFHKNNFLFEQDA